MPDLPSSLEFYITIAIFAVSAAIVGYVSWLERRPRTKLMPRMLPTTPVILIFGFIGILALVHIANLYGIHTGRNPKY